MILDIHLCYFESIQVHMKTKRHSFVFFHIDTVQLIIVLIRKPKEQDFSKNENEYFWRTWKICFLLYCCEYMNEDALHFSV